VPARAIVVTPAARGSRSGNRTTALRIAALLRRCGLSVAVRTPATRDAADLLVAVHAVKTRDCVLAHHHAQPDRHRVVLLAGTDIYPDFAPEPATLAALQAASAIVALQPLALRALPAALRAKARTIVQSAVASPATARPADHFAVCVLAHLRTIKQPLLPFEALACIDRSLPIRVTLAGRGLDPELATAAAAWPMRDPRARYCGELGRLAARRLIAGSHLLVVPSAAEGGANVLSEAIAAGTPVVATAVPGNLGLLGADWPGLFPPGDAAALGALLAVLAQDRAAYAALARRTVALQGMVAVTAELAAWRNLLVELGLAVPECS